MRALVVALSLVLGAGLHAAQPVSAAITSPYQALESQSIAPGVRHEHGRAAATNGGVALHIVEADPSTPGISLLTTAAFEKVNARERSTAQAGRISREGLRVVATINGSTFGSWPSPPYAARGLNVTNGELVTAGHPRHGERLSSFAIDHAGRPLIGAPSMSMSVSLADGSRVPLARVNQPRQSDEASLFTPRFDAATPAATTGVEIVVGGVDLPIRTSGSWSGTVLEVRPAMGSTPLLPNAVVVSAIGLAADGLAGVQPGDELEIDLSIDPGWEGVRQAVGAREILIKDGKVDIWPLGGNTFNTSEPRTAVGFTGSGRLLLVAIDGRQTHSRGLTIPETAELMRSLGAVQAVNLDGGGSTMMAVRSPGEIEAAIVNSPSTSGTERSVANALHLVSSIPTGPLDALVVRPAWAELEVGQSRQLIIGGHDAAYNGIAVGPSDVAWSSSSETVTVDGQGMATAVAPGEVIISAAHAGLTATSSISVQGAPVPVGPTVPEGLTATAHDNFVIKLSWQASSSSVAGPIHYRVFRNGTAIGTQQLALTYTDQRKAANTFEYKVRAIDAAGNKSALSAPVTITAVQYADGSAPTPAPTPTPAPSPSPSPTPPPSSGPSVPQGLTAVAEPGFVVKLSWQASTSSVAGTIRYRVFRNGSAIGTQQTALTYTDQRKKVNTFSYQVRAIDAAGNKSALSPPITVTTRP
jgi:hypothetical protein